MSHIISREEWFNAQRKARELQREYNISIDPAVLLYTPRPELVLAGQNKNMLNLLGGDEFIARPVGFKAYQRGILIKYPNGIKTYIHIDGEGEEKAKKAMEVIRSYHYVMKNGQDWKIVEIYKLTEDVPGALEVVEKYGKRKALMLSLGLSETGFDVYWHRAVVLIERGHLVELSEPGTGKTTYAHYISRVMGGVVMSEAPTSTYLIGDMRDGSFGVVFTANVIFFDEIDKMKGDKFRTAYPSILEGLENCKWIRTSGKGLEISRCITAAFLGNTMPQEKSRTALVQHMSKLLGINAQPLVDRIPFISFSAERFRTEFLGDMLRPSATRGIARILAEEAEEKAKQYREKVDARKAWAYAVIHTLLSWVFENEPDESQIQDIYTFGRT